MPTETGMSPADWGKAAIGGVALSSVVAFVIYALFKWTIPALMAGADARDAANREASQTREALLLALIDRHEARFEVTLKEQRIDFISHLQAQQDHMNILEERKIKDMHAMTGSIDLLTKAVENISEAVGTSTTHSPVPQHEKDKHKL